MNTLSIWNDSITIDGEKYYHYTFGGKWTATKWIVWNGIYWYNSNKPPIEEKY